MQAFTPRKITAIVSLLSLMVAAVLYKWLGLTRADTLVYVSKVSGDETKLKPEEGHVHPASETVKDDIYMSSSQPSEVGGQWKCCVNPHSVNRLWKHPEPQTVQDQNHDYGCPDYPSNFSWYFVSESHPEAMSLDSKKWRNRSIYFVGGSTTRQMLEQYRWEMPLSSKDARTITSRYLFDHIEDGKYYTRSHIVDLRRLHPKLQETLEASPEFIIFNVGPWWSTNNVGYVFDKKGTKWKIGSGENNDSEWYTLNKTTTGISKPDLSFANLMKMAIKLMIRFKSPKTTLVWRSEGTTDCPPSNGYRGSVGPVLTDLRVPVLNISVATCEYLIRERNGYDKEKRGPHLCFPSVALRHWLLRFQHQFL